MAEMRKTKHQSERNYGVRGAMIFALPVTGTSWPMANYSMFLNYISA